MIVMLVGRPDAPMSADAFARVQLGACRLRCDNRKVGPSSTSKKKKSVQGQQASWRPWGFKLLVADTDCQFSDILVLHNALQSYASADRNIISIQGLKFLFLPSQELISAAYESVVHSVKQDPWVILNGTYAPKLTKILCTLSNVGVNISDVLSISHTCSYGQSGLRMMDSNNNILIRFKRLGAAIQLAQWWNDLDISRTLSRLGRVLVIYGTGQVPLNEQALEPRLHSPVLITDSDPLKTMVTDGAAKKQCKPIVTSQSKSMLTSRHELRNGKTYAQTILSNGKRSAEEMEDDFSEMNKMLLRVSREQPAQVYTFFGEAFRNWVDSISLSQIGEKEELMTQYRLLCSIAAKLQGSTFSTAVQALASATVSASTSEAMEISPDEPLGNTQGVDDDVMFGPISFMEHDVIRSMATPSDGACGYASLCMVLKHAEGRRENLDPAYYRSNILLLATDLWHLAQTNLIKSFPIVRTKFLTVSTMLGYPGWDTILAARRELWLTIEQVILVLHASDVPYRGWIWATDGFECFVDKTKPHVDYCYNMMVYKGHFYIHSRTDTTSVPAALRSTRPIPWLSKIGSIYVPWEGQAEDDLDVWGLMVDHVQQRSPHFCGIYPALAEVTEFQKLRLRRGDGNLATMLSYNTREPVDIELMQFYWEHQGGNQWATVEDHRIFNMCLSCMTAKQEIPAGTLIAPVVGAITTEPGSFSAIPCYDTYEEFRGVSAYLDPTPVGYDAGYNIYGCYRIMD